MIYMSGNRFTLKTVTHLHLVGIGGSGISAIARVLLLRGFTVSGSDRIENDQTLALRSEGATVSIGHDAENIRGSDAVVISSAIPEDNPEILAARDAGIPVFKRAEFIGYLMTDYIGIAVAGSHGKTTTTGMIAHILVDAGYDPTVILGGVLPEWGTNGRVGQGSHFIIEADEYDHMFLGLKPDFAVITNIEHDHPDIFATRDDYLHDFRQFAKLIPQGGQLVVCGEDEGVIELLQTLHLPSVEITSYGLEQQPLSQSLDFQAGDCRPNQLGGTDFLLTSAGQSIGLVRLRVPGLHNVLNALAAIIISFRLEIDFALICRSLAGFGGVGRRFQVTGEVGGVTIIDDYAHHPTEIKATLAAARQRYPERRLWAVWQPHTFSRTKLMLSQFASSFDNADRVIGLDIYHSRESDTLAVSTAVVIEAMNHERAVYIPQIKDAVIYLLDRVRPDDVVITLGAGDGNLVGQKLLEKIKDRAYSFRP
jgi:UDP-N-acetylmuramate--alanine ligase